MDSKLWQDIRNGDANAMKLLYQNSYQERYAYGFKIIADKDKVKDCLHEVFSDIWQKRSRIGEVSQVKAYLKTCVRHQLFKAIKQDQRTDQLNKQEYSYEQLLIAAENHANAKIKMWKAINKLTPMQREVIKLKFYEDLSYEAISIMLKLKPRTIYNHIYAAICALRTELSKS